MEWILYIVVGLFLIGFLWGIGLIPEFLGMIGVIIAMSLISGTVAWIFDWGFENGAQVGVFIGVGFYILYCIGRIINPEIRIDVYSDGSKEVFSERWNGVIGLIVVILSILAVLL